MITRIKVVTDNLGENTYIPQRKILWFWRTFRDGSYMYSTPYQLKSESSARRIISEEVTYYLSKGTSKVTII